MRLAVAPLDPASPAGIAQTIALGDVLDEIEAAIRARELAETPAVAELPARTPRRRKAA